MRARVDVCSGTCRWGRTVTWRGISSASSLGSRNAAALLRTVWGVSYDYSETARRPMGGQGVPWEEARHDHNLPGARRARDPDVEGLLDRIVLCSAH